tara:strand:+ start:172974 stop:173909 length:936 start_codon:yes stop_codon:yes gene_type:complete
MLNIDIQGNTKLLGTLPVKEIFNQCGAMCIKNTGVAHGNELLAYLPNLGFSEEEQFYEGGRTSKNWQEKWAEKGLRRMDHYPAHLFLLPNNEIQYQRSFPNRVLFFHSIQPESGGRINVHSASKVTDFICAQGDQGTKLYDKIAKYGMTIEVGFLDKNHPQKSDNYFKSWQEVCETEDPAHALQSVSSQIEKYDECWWKKDGDHDVLMTRITLSSVFKDSRDGNDYLRFPRIAANGPSAINGFRRFPLGDGRDLSAAELQILRNAYNATKEGAALKQGDLILMDNIRYGHSREPYQGKREILLSMAGFETI